MAISALSSFGIDCCRSIQFVDIHTTYNYFIKCLITKTKVIHVLFTFVACTFTYILTDYIGNRCFSEARRDGYDDLITQTDIVLTPLVYDH